MLYTFKKKHGGEGGQFLRNYTCGFLALTPVHTATLTCALAHTDANLYIHTEEKVFKCKEFVN